MKNMKLEIKKIDKKIELDTKVEGCLSDCWTGKYTYTAYNAECIDAGVGECIKKKQMSAKDCWFW